MLWWSEVSQFLILSNKDKWFRIIRNYFKFKKLLDVDIIEDLENYLSQNDMNPWALIMNLIYTYNDLDKAFLISRRDSITRRFTFNKSRQVITSEASQLCDEIVYYKLVCMDNVSTFAETPIIITLNNRDSEIDLVTSNGTSITLNKATTKTEMIKHLKPFLKQCEYMFKDILHDYWDCDISEINNEKLKIINVRISEFSSKTSVVKGATELLGNFSDYKLENCKQTYLKDNLYSEYYFYTGWTLIQISNTIYRIDFNMGFYVHYMNFANPDNLWDLHVNAYVYDKIANFMKGIKTNEGFISEIVLGVANGFASIPLENFN